MEKYKPSYLGKVIPVDNPSKMSDFMTNKYDSFNKIYDSCKNQSANIETIKPVDTKDTSSLSVKITSAPNTISEIKEGCKNDASVKIENDVITATVKSN